MGVALSQIFLIMLSPGNLIPRIVPNIITRPREGANPLNGRHKEHHLGHTLRIRIPGWLTVKLGN